MKPEPAQQGHADDGDKGHDGGHRLYAPHQIGTQHIGVGEKPDDENLGEGENIRITQAGEEMGEVADDVGQPVHKVGLIPHIVAEGFAAVGIGSSRRRIDGGQLGESQPQTYGPHASDDPADERDAAYGGQVGGQHEYARSHHVAGHHQGGGDNSDFIPIVLTGVGSGVLTHDTSSRDG